MPIFKRIVSDIGLHNEQLVEIMLLQLERNVEEHEVIRQYMAQCNKSRINVEFFSLMDIFTFKWIIKIQRNRTKNI